MPASARALPRRCTAPRAIALAALMTGAAVSPALGQPATVTVSSYVELPAVNSVMCGNYCVRLHGLDITPSGELNAPVGISLQLTGLLNNLGRLRAAYGSETGGLFLNASGVNGEDALVEAHNVTLYGTGVVFDNRGRLETGIYTLPDGRAVTVPSQGAGLAIGEGVTVRNLAPTLATSHPSNGSWRSFGGVVLNGVLDNFGSYVAALGPNVSATGPYEPSLRVTMLSGSVVQARVFNRAGARLDLQAGAALNNGGLVENSGVIAVGDGARLYNNPATSTQALNGRLAGVLDNQPGGRLEIGSGSGTAAAQLLNFDGGLIVNRGEIVLRRASEYLGAAGSMLDNDGSLQQLAGASITVNGGLLNQPGGTLDLAGYSQWLGYLGNQGMLRSRTGSMLIAGVDAALYNEVDGHIELGGDMDLHGRLYNLAPFGTGTPTIDILATGSLTVRQGGVVEQGPNSRLNNLGLVRVAGQMTGLLSDGSTPPTTAAQISNQGDFVIETGAKVHAVSFDQLAGQLQVQGELRIDAAVPGNPAGMLTMLGGSLSGSGTINGETFFLGSGLPQNTPGCNPAPPAGVPCFRPGNSPGQMTIDGPLTMSASILELEVERDAAGVLHWDHVSASSMRFLDGTLIHLQLGDGAPGAQPADIELLSCPGGCDFSGAVFAVSGAGAGQFSLGAQGLSFTLAPVPEPQQWALWLAGLAGLGALARRRRAGASAG